MRFRSTASLSAWLGALVMVHDGVLCARPPGKPQVLVMLQNAAGAPAGLVDGAKTDVTRLFGDIGVDIVWTVKVAPDHRNLRFLVLTDFEPGLSAARGLIFGFTQSLPGVRGVRGYVFLPRLERLARTFRISPEKLLAVALAHELGHTLLPDASHAATGIMRAPWDESDLRAASSGRLQFSPDSARLIRLGAAGHTSQ